MSRENHEEDGAPPQRAEGTSVWEHLPWGKGGDLPWSHLPGGQEGAMPPLPAWCSLLGGLTAQLARGGAHSTAGGWMERSLSSGHSSPQVS